MTTKQKRIRRYENLLATLNRTLDLITADDHAIWEQTANHTRQNIERVNILLAAAKKL